MKKSSHFKILGYLVLVLSLVFILLPASEMAKKSDNNWWDVVPEEENPSTFYDS